MIAWVAAEALWKRQGYSVWPQTSAYLKSASEGEKELSVSRLLDGHVSNFISAQDPTAIVKVEAGIGMVT